MAENKSSSNTGMVVAGVVIVGAIGLYLYTKFGKSSPLAYGGGGGSGSGASTSVAPTPPNPIKLPPPFPTVNSGNGLSPTDNAIYSQIFGIKAPQGVYGSPSTGFIVVGQNALMSGINLQNTAIIPSLGNSLATAQAGHQAFVQLNRLNGVV